MPRSPQCFSAVARLADAPESVGTILDTIARHWPVDSKAEVTLEANPNSVEAARFKGYRAAGINRVSIGVQSLRDEPLRTLGRLHSVDEAIAAVRLSQTVFRALELRSHLCRPHQTLAEWEDELRQALDLQRRSHLALPADHRDGTRYYDMFRAGKLQMPSGDLSADFYELTQRICADAVCRPTRSQSCRTGQESRHNLLYWRYGEYVGIGPAPTDGCWSTMSRHATATEKMPFKWRDRVLGRGHGLVTERPSHLGGGGRRISRHGAAADRRQRPGPLYALSGRSIDPRQVEDLKFAEMIETLPNGNIRVTDRDSRCSMRSWRIWRRKDRVHCLYCRRSSEHICSRAACRVDRLAPRR